MLHVNAVPFKHKGLRRYMVRGDILDIPQRYEAKIRRILARPNVARGPQDMDLPGFHLHLLEGERLGHWSLRVSENWRVVFRFEGEDVSRVDLTDYH